MSVSHFGTLGSHPRGRTECTRALGAGKAIKLIVGTKDIGTCPWFYLLSVSMKTHSGMETMMATSQDRGGWKPRRCSVRDYRQHSLLEAGHQPAPAARNMQTLNQPWRRTGRTWQAVGLRQMGRYSG